MAEFNSYNLFQVFEQSSYNTKHEGKEGKILPIDLFEALKSFAGDRDLPWYTLTANGVRFHQFVGAIQVGPYCIEVLPKVDKYQGNEISTQMILIKMLRQAGYLSVKAPTDSNLKLKQNFILEAYISMFLDETWELIHRGLVKYYHKVEGNNKSLKGSLVFNKHINQNNIHAERFYTKYSIYDREHPLNRILIKTLKLITKLPVSYETSGTAITQLNILPELEDISIDDNLFSKIRYDRKTEAYKKAIDISRLLLLNYHPDLAHGRNNVLALMFDMNDVWETWFTKRMILAAKRFHDLEIRAQLKKTFWTSSVGEKVRQKPDIIIEIAHKPAFVLDTKWKVVSARPSEDDIRQMFAYNKLFGIRKAWLVYPGESRTVQGQFYEYDNNGGCGLSFIKFLEDDKLSDEGIKDFLNVILAN